MQKIKFFLRPRYDSNSDGLTLVELNLRIDGIENRFSLNYYIPLKNWDRKNKRVIAGKGLPKLDALRMETDLTKLLNKAEDIKRNALEQDDHISLEVFENRMMSNLQGFDLIQFSKNYVEENPLCWAEATINSYNGLISLLTEIYPLGIFAGDIPTIRQKVEKFLVNNGRGLNTRRKRHKQIKSMISRAMRTYNLRQPYVDPIGETKGNRNFLEPKELKAAIKLYKTGDLQHNLQSTLEQFLFSCFTGCRYGDMVELNRKNIVQQKLVYIAQKTRRFEKRVEAPMPAVALPLIQNSTGRLFNMKTEQVVNRDLKRIFQRLDINKHITYHCSRHTFGTMYIYLGGDLTNLQEIMAHADIKTTMEYVKLAKRLNNSDYQLFDEEFGEDMKVITSGTAFFMEVS